MGNAQRAQQAGAGGGWLQDKVEDVVPDAIDGGIEPFVKPFTIGIADDHYEIDISRARSLLGWAPQRRLRDTLQQVVDALRRDPPGWYRRNRIPLPPWLAEASAAGVPVSALIEGHARGQQDMHQRTLWCHFANAALGLWLMSSPFVFGLPLTRTWMTASDLLTGISQGFQRLPRRRRWRRGSRWSCCPFRTGRSRVTTPNGMRVSCERTRPQPMPKRRISHALASSVTAA